MKFEFNIIRPAIIDSAMYQVDRDHSWDDSLIGVSDLLVAEDLLDAVVGKSTYVVVCATDTNILPVMFERNNILVVADRVQPITDAGWWSNILRAHAIACDYWTKQTILEHVPSLSTKRFLDLTGVMMTTFEPDNEHEDDEPNDGFVYAGPEDSFFRAVRDFVKHTAYMDRPDGTKRRVELLQDANKFANYNVLLAPQTHSALWLDAMAHRSGIIIHNYNPLHSYNLDPRGNSTTIESIVNTQRELAGSTSFKKYIENLMDELPALVNSLQQNSYKRPKGSTLVDRLFAEINKSSY